MSSNLFGLDWLRLPFRPAAKATAPILEHGETGLVGTTIATIAQARFHHFFQRLGVSHTNCYIIVLQVLGFRANNLVTCSTMLRCSG